MEPTPDQIDAYRRDGFLVVERFLEHDEVDRLRERFKACFAHEFETGLRPDEGNYDPKSKPPDLTRQLCNAWKADRAIAQTVLARRNAEFGAKLAGVPGLRLAQDNLIWKPPSGKALLCHQDAAVRQGPALPPGRRLPRPPPPAEHDDVLDGARRHERGHRHDLLRQGLEPLAARPARRRVPRARRLARARA